jgi:hypothetical protein
MSVRSLVVHSEVLDRERKEGSTIAPASPM